MSRPSPQRELGRDKRGAVYVEFLGAFFPIFLSFWCLLQSAGMYSAKLVTMNAAYLGARAAAVVIPDNPSRYSKVGVYEVTGKRKDAIVKAVQMGLAANGSLWWPLADVTVRGADGKEKSKLARDQVVIVRVSVPYSCGLPLADTIVCGFAGFRNVNAEAAMVVHGADYVYP